MLIIKQAAVHKKSRKDVVFQRVEIFGNVGFMMLGSDLGRKGAGKEAGVN